MDTRSSRILAHHAAFMSLTHNMQLFFFNARFGSACFGQGKRRAAIHISPFFPVTYCGVVPCVKDYITPLANPPSCHVLSDNLVLHVPCRATGVPAAAF
ncbi:MAG: hypothetical protein ACLQT6_17225 [Desulfomonilaceae bacterium]